MSRSIRPTSKTSARRSRSALRLGLPSALAAAILTGCIDQQKEVSNYEKTLGRDTQPKLRTDYSHGEELSLEAALLLTNNGSEQLSIQGETYLQSLIARDRAYSAFMPTISLAPSLNFANRRGGASSVVSTGTTGGTGTGSGGTGAGGTGTGTGSTGTSSGGTQTAGTSHGYTSFSAPITGQMNVFNGFRDVSTLQANQFNVKAQKLTLMNLQATVMLETAQTYYNVLLAERSVDVLSHSASYQDALVNDQRARYRAGIAQPLDVAQSEAQAAATHAQLVTAEDSVQTNRAMLAFMTNAAVEKAALVDRLEVPPDVLGIDDAVRVAERERLDILAAAEQVRVQQQNLQTATGEYYPSISLDLNYYLHRDTFPTNVEWAGVITASVPIFSAGEIRADVRNAMSLLRTVTYTEWQLIREVRENVRIDWDNLSASRRRIVELETEVAASQEALRQAVERYRVGLAINLDVLNAETQLLSAQLSLAQEQINFKVFYLDLLRDMGRLPLPKSAQSMSSGPTSRPTTQETSPLAPSLQGGNGGLPSGAGYPSTQPGMPGPDTQPTTSPTTFPSIEPAPMPTIDFNLRPTVGPDTGPAEFPDTQSASLPTTEPTTSPSTAPSISPRPRRRRPG
jgi:multidrug efflux system outer membrane protein